MLARLNTLRVLVLSVKKSMQALLKNVSVIGQRLLNAKG